MLAGESIPDPKTLGLDALFPAFFLVLVWTELGDRAARVTAVAATLIAFVLIPIAPPGIPVVAASLAVLVGAGGAAMKRDVWIAIGVLTVICFVIKAAGPVALGGRDLPRWAERLIVLLPAALLSALVVVQTFADGKALVLDARAAGLAAADRRRRAAGERARRAARRGADRGGAARARRRLEQRLPVGDPLALVAQARLEREERAARAAAVVECLDRLEARELLAVGGELRRRPSARGRRRRRPSAARGRAAPRGPPSGSARQASSARRPASVIENSRRRRPPCSRRSATRPAFASRSGSA